MNTERISADTGDFTRKMPCSLPSERALLGAILIDPASITRMASSHPDNRETTMYGRHGKHDGKPPKIKRSRTKTDKPKHPIEQVMPIIMLAVSIVFLVGMILALWFMPVSEPENMIVRPILTGLIGVAAVSADIPAWVYFSRWRRDS